MSKYNKFFNKHGYYIFRNILKDEDIFLMKDLSKKILSTVKGKNRKECLFYIDNITNYYPDISKFEKNKIFSLVNRIEKNNRLVKDVYFWPKSEDGNSIFLTSSKSHKNVFLSPFDFSVKYAVLEGDFEVACKWREININKKDVVVYDSNIPLIFHNTEMIPLFNFVYTYEMLISEESLPNHTLSEHSNQVFWG